MKGIAATMPQRIKSTESRLSNSGQTTRWSSLLPTWVEWTIRLAKAINRPFLSALANSKCIAASFLKPSEMARMGATYRVRVLALQLIITGIEVQRLHQTPTMANWRSACQRQVRCARSFLLGQTVAMLQERCPIWCHRRLMCSREPPLNTLATRLITGDRTIVILWLFRSRKRKERLKWLSNWDLSTIGRLQIWRSI